MTRLAFLASCAAFALGLTLSPSLTHAQFAPAPGEPPRLELSEPMQAPPPRPDRAGPISLLAAGGATTLFGGISLLVVGVQSMDSFEDGAPDQTWLVVGSAAVAVGLPLLFAGLYWLFQEVSGSGEQAQGPPGVIRF